MKAVILHTQCLENYGSVGEPWWKCKGGMSVYVANIEGHVDKTMVLNGLPNEVAEVETRNSSMYIEYVKDVEFTSVEEAERRAAINMDDPCLSHEEFFDAIYKLDMINNYKA